jgi:hypothetical protein
MKLIRKILGWLASWWANIRQPLTEDEKHDLQQW